MRLRSRRPKMQELISSRFLLCCPARISKARRSLKLGWVSDFDDENGQFLVLFADEPPKYDPAKAADEPFQLMSMPNKKAATVRARRGQQRFRFQVMAQYGSKCAVCDICYPALLKAVHICGVAQQGSDDWRNGLPLCATHHDEFDDHLFCIHPKSKAIECKPGISARRNWATRGETCPGVGRLPNAAKKRNRLAFRIEKPTLFVL